jgi:uncharacterized membrane protein HdeD (DUF308 family)
VLLSMMAAYAIVAGVLQIALGFQLRRLQPAREQLAPTQSPTP